MAPPDLEATVGMDHGNCRRPEFSCQLEFQPFTTLEHFHSHSCSNAMAGYSEADVISCVRCNSAGAVGFLADRSRLCVALSRDPRCC